MVKKFSTLALVALLALPAVSSAAASPAELEAQIQRLTKELGALQQQMADLKESTESTVDSIEENSQKWDEASRIQLSGDFRTRLDYVTAETAKAYTALDVAKGVTSFTSVQPQLVAIAAGAGWANIGAMSAALGPAMVDGTGQPNLNTWSANAAGMGITDPGQQKGLFYMFTNPEVGGMLASMAAMPTTAITDAMKDALSLASFMKNLSPAARNAIFAGMGYTPQAPTDYDNDTLWTNRLRVNLRAKATEDVEFKARLSMYKSWGMENNPVDYTTNAGMGGGAFMLNSLSFDGNSTRQPEDNALRVDRAFMNWNAIGGSPFWFSIGRRPTTDGPPAQFRMGADERLATPVAYMDYPFDGLSIGYAYKSLFGVEDFPGRVRFCYGRGFESGPTDNGDGLKDVDFAGFSWDVYSKGNRFFNIQSFAAFDMFNVPDGVKFVNPDEYARYLMGFINYDQTDPTKNLILDRANLGNIYHTDAVYYSKVQDLNYFLSLGWSRTKADGMDELGNSLLGTWGDEPTDKDGYSVYAGVRYDIPDSPVKVGLEYNYGTKNWIAFTPGNDDLYASKLATRGHVVEAYGIWDIPTGEAISRFGKAFMRLGYQHYKYDYTGSGFWLGEPLDVDDLPNDPLAAQFYTPVQDMDQVYLSIEAWF